MADNSLPDVTRPVCRHYGGKWRLAPWIISHFPAHELYIEPFGGAASVLLRKQPAKVEIYNDINRYAVNLFRVLQDRELSARLIDMFHLTLYASEELRRAADLRDHPDPVVRAWGFVVRSAFSIAATEKPNASGFDNNPRNGRTIRENRVVPWNNYPRSLKATIERLKRVRIENKDAIKLISNFTREYADEALVYCDPPYLLSARSGGPQYRHEIDRDYHIRLGEAVKGSKMMFLISGYESELYADLYKGWRVVSKEARTIAKSKRTECLWISPNADRKLQAVRDRPGLFKNG
ncbi:MAG: DNA adenine methylase [Deltaproteobacteria bacterium]|nr:DNA adenine methylase [Deltaproteobacteria bacterium]